MFRRADFGFIGPELSVQKCNLWQVTLSKSPFSHQRMGPILPLPYLPQGIAVELRDRLYKKMFYKLKSLCKCAVIVLHGNVLIFWKHFSIQIQDLLLSLSKKKELSLFLHVAFVTL